MRDAHCSPRWGCQVRDSTAKRCKVAKGFCIHTYSPDVLQTHRPNVAALVLRGCEMLVVVLEQLSVDSGYGHEDGDNGIKMWLSDI